MKTIQVKDKSLNEFMSNHCISVSDKISCNGAVQGDLFLKKGALNLSPGDHLEIEIEDVTRHTGHKVSVFNLYEAKSYDDIAIKMELAVTKLELINK